MILILLIFYTFFCNGAITELPFENGVLNHAILTSKLIESEIKEQDNTYEAIINNINNDSVQQFVSDTFENKNETNNFDYAILSNNFKIKDITDLCKCLLIIKLNVKTIETKNIKIHEVAPDQKTKIDSACSTVKRLTQRMNAEHQFIRCLFIKNITYLTNPKYEKTLVKNTMLWINELGSCCLDALIEKQKKTIANNTKKDTEALPLPTQTVSSTELIKTPINTTIGPKSVEPKKSTSTEQAKPVNTHPHSPKQLYEKKKESDNKKFQIKKGTQLQNEQATEDDALSTRKDKKPFGGSTLSSFISFIKPFFSVIMQPFNTLWQACKYIFKSTPKKLL